MKYELVSPTVVIKGKKFKKENSRFLNDSQLPAKDLEASYAAGFIKPEGTKAKTADEVKAQYLQERKEVKPICDFPNDMPFKDVLLENKILTYEQLNAVGDLTTLKGIGKASAETLTQWLKK